MYSFRTEHVCTHLGGTDTVLGLHIRRFHAGTASCLRWLLLEGLAELPLTASAHPVSPGVSGPLPLSAECWLVSHCFAHCSHLVLTFIASPSPRLVPLPSVLLLFRERPYSCSMGSSGRQQWVPCRTAGQGCAGSNKELQEGAVPLPLPSLISQLCDSLCFTHLSSSRCSPCACSHIGGNPGTAVQFWAE